MRTRLLRRLVLFSAFIMIAAPILAQAHPGMMLVCPPGACTLPDGACGVPVGDACLTCSEASGGVFCARPNNSCGYDCRVPQCGTYFNQCIDPSWGNCIEGGFCIRTNNTCGYYCEAGSVCDDRVGQCIDVAEAECLMRPCDWINGACDCERTCREAGCDWIAQDKRCDCRSPCERKGCIWNEEEGCDCETPCVQNGCKWDDASQTCDCSKQPPEPATIILMGTGLAMLGLSRKLRRRKPQPPIN